MERRLLASTKPTVDETPALRAQNEHFGHFAARSCASLGDCYGEGLMQMVGPPDIHYLSAAIGWMELGNPREALNELAKVDPALAQHPGVLEVKWTVCAAAKNWGEALEAAEQLVVADAEHATGWLHRAYALRRVPEGGLQAAWNALLPAVDRFPQEPTIPYNLACYACQMGNLEEARRWLGRAFGVGDTAKIKSMAAADDDLKPLWTEIQSW